MVSRQIPWLLDRGHGSQIDAMAARPWPWFQGRDHGCKTEAMHGCKTDAMVARQMA